MALKTNFTDDILSESMNGKRQYNVTENSNGTKSLEDVTDYQSVGSTFSAKDMNETNAAVNQAYDDMGDEFNPKVDYAVGDYTIHNNKVWKFTTAHPAGAWDESHVKATKILSEARELTENFKWKLISEQVVVGGTVNVKEYNEVLVLFVVYKVSVYGNLLIPVDVIKNYPNGACAVGAYDGANYFGMLTFNENTITVSNISDARFSFSFYGR